MKIGRLNLSDYAAKKPVSITPAGEFVSLQEITDKPELALVSLFTLDINLQIKLAVKRISLEPDFKFGVLGGGVYTRDQVIEAVKKQETELGKQVLKAEMYYLNVLIASLANPTIIPKWPEDIKPIKPIIPDWRRRKRCIYLRITNRVLFCENTTDPITTKFANYRFANVHTAFVARGFTVIKLDGSDDVRSEFALRAKNPMVVYIAGVGHGGYTVYTGHMHDHILEACSYDPEEVKNKSIHLLSCQTAKTLGPDTISKGAKSYAGYTENFNLLWDIPGTGVNEFELFAKCDSSYDITMAAGLTAQEAYDRTVAAFNAAMALPEVVNTQTASTLLWDRDHLKLHGDHASTVVPFQMVKICFPLVLGMEDILINAGDLEEIDYSRI